MARSRGTDPLHGPGEAKGRLSRFPFDRRPTTTSFGRGQTAGDLELYLDSSSPTAGSWPMTSAISGAAASKARSTSRVAIRGGRSDIYLDAGAKIHPMVVLDAEHGPIYIDEGAEDRSLHTHRGAVLHWPRYGALRRKCRAGNSIGPMCRVGGEVEGTIIQGYSNKYHDGFLGHAYVGEWVNLGASTTNSDLKNDYSEVKITLDGRTQIPTGSNKVGALIGDHAKTSIGTLLNTGALRWGDDIARRRRPAHAQVHSIVRLVYQRRDPPRHGQGTTLRHRQYCDVAARPPMDGAG